MSLFGRITKTMNVLGCCVANFTGAVVSFGVCDVAYAPFGHLLQCVLNDSRAVVVGEPETPAASAVAIPAAWQAWETGAGGYIGPVSAQLDLLRGASAVYQNGALKIGGKILIGPAGKVFAFSTKSAADLWAAINTKRAERDLELMAGLPADASAVYRARKKAALDTVGVQVVAASARCADQSRAAALIAESDWCFAKWL